MSIEIVKNEDMFYNFTQYIIKELKRNVSFYQSPYILLDRPLSFSECQEIVRHKEGGKKEVKGAWKERRRWCMYTCTPRARNLNGFRG